MRNSGDRKDATASSHDLAAALAELAALRARLIDEASNRHGTATCVRGAALRWHGFVTYAEGHYLPSEAMEEALENLAGCLGQIMESPSDGLLDVALKLAVLQISMRKDAGESPEQIENAELLASAMADAVVLAAITPIGGAA